MAAQGELGPVIKEVSLQLRGRLRGFKIDRGEKGIVLHGSAPSYYVKQLALCAVQRMTPEPVLHNEIEVV
jgi:hypothetical protein